LHRRKRHVFFFVVVKYSLSEVFVFEV